MKIKEIVQKFKEGETLTEIGKQNGVTGERVRQVILENIDKRDYKAMMLKRKAKTQYNKKVTYIEKYYAK